MLFDSVLPILLLLNRVILPSLPPEFLVRPCCRHTPDIDQKEDGCGRLLTLISCTQILSEAYPKAERRQIPRVTAGEAHRR